MSRNELTFLATQAHRALRIVEVGVWKGRATKAMSDHTLGVIHAVDHWCGQSDTSTTVNTELAARGAAAVRDEFHLHLADAIAEGRVQVLEMSASRALVSLLARYGSKSMDFVFLDGDHTTEAVYEESLLAELLIRPGGMIAGHDYQIPQVRDALAQRHWTTKQVEQIWYVGF